MAPQAQLEESANDLGQPGSGRSQKTVRLGVVCRPGSPFLSVFFLKSQMNSSQKSSKKGLTKKKGPVSDIRENLADLELGPDRVLDSQMSDTSRKTSQKVSRKREADLS